MITLKSVKYYAGMSEETHAYSATVYFNNRPCAKVSNRGHGGPDEEYITNQAAWKDMMLYIAALPKKKSSFFPDGMPQDLEGICCDLVNDFYAARDLKRLMAKRVVYTRKGKPGIYQTQCVKAATLDKWIKQIGDDYKTERVLNSTPFTAALAIFKGAT